MEQNYSKIDIYEGLSDEVKVMAKAAHAFSDALTTHTKVMESVATNTKDVKDYFTEAKGGFLEDLDKKDAIILAAIREHNQTLVGALEKNQQALLELLKEENTKFLTTVTDKTEHIEQEVSAISKNIVTKVSILFFGASALLGFIVYVIENTIIKSQSVEIVKEVLKQLNK